MRRRTREQVDVVIVGSGFGGSVSALRLTEKGYKVAVVEAGRRYEGKDFAKTNWDARKSQFAPKLGLWGIQRLTLMRHVFIAASAGVGGGSLVYANTLYEPLDGFYNDPQWSDITDWRTELAPHYQSAKRMLGVTTAPVGNPADELLIEIGRRMGVEDTFQPSEVGVFFGEPGVTVPDPYFGGAGPERAGCIQCGGCMVGCRHNAKNSLDRNYLYLAEQAGAVVYPERTVSDVEPTANGYIVRADYSGLGRRGRSLELEADHVVFAAGVLGSVKLLLKLKAKGRLPDLSPKLGELVRTNSESIQGAFASTVQEPDITQGVAISGSIFPNDHTHIEAIRYPKGSNSLGMLLTLLVPGEGRLPRPLRFVGKIARHPIKFVRSRWLYRFVERSVMLLTMQSVNNSIALRWKRSLLGGRMISARGDGDPTPTFIAESEEASQHAADIIGGEPYGSITEAIFNVPTTAHILGGCPIGDDDTAGVIDPYHRVYGYPGLHVVDGSAITANLGVNPSLTITAQAERAMALWPNKGDADLRPSQGERYQRLDPIAPDRPAVPTG